MKNVKEYEGAKNVSWPWLSPLQEWDSLTVEVTGKFVYGSIFHLATAQSLWPYG